MLLSVSQKRGQLRKLRQLRVGFTRSPDELLIGFSLVVFCVSCVQKGRSGVRLLDSVKYSDPRRRVFASWERCQPFSSWVSDASDGI